MGIFSADTSIKTAIALGIQDIRDNVWLIDHMLEDMVSNPYLKDKYGQKQIDACKEWVLNNEINIAMVDVNDRDRYPLVTITLGTSNEKNDMKTLAEQSTESIKLLPQEINKPIAFVVRPAIVSYDSPSGEVTFPDGTALEQVAVGMILVDPLTGNGYEILDVAGDYVVIEDSIALSLPAAKYAIVPQYQFYKARIGHSFFQETYNIGCHVHGDPQSLLWLHSIVLMALLRYREGLLEANGFAESTISSSDMMPNPNFNGPGGEMAWTRMISLTGQVENTWIKAPRRIIESVNLGNTVTDGFQGGIKILSNLDSPNNLDNDDQVWTTVEDGASE